MTIKVTINQTPVKIENISTGDNTTVVQKVIVGRPVRRVVENKNNINELNGIDTKSKVDGSVLVYNTNNNLWESTLDLEKQNINGGQY